MRAFLLTISLVVVLAGCGMGDHSTSRPGAAVSASTATKDPAATASPSEGIGLVRQACAEYEKSLGFGGATMDAVVADSTAHRQRAVALAAHAEAVNVRWVRISNHIHTYSSKKVAFGNELDTNGVGTSEGAALITAVGEAGSAFEKACAKVEL
jgi:hypothetical protein